VEFLFGIRANVSFTGPIGSSKAHDLVLKAHRGIEWATLGMKGISIRFRPENRVFKFARWTRKIAILDALATQFHAKSGLISLSERSELILVTESLS
jgi:hypothetical protein